MSATLQQLRDAVVATLSGALTGVNVLTHGGTFDEAAVKKYGAKAPAAIVVVAGVGDLEQYCDGEIKAPVHFAVVAFARDMIANNAKVDRDMAAAGMAGAIQLALFNNQFGLDGVFIPKDLRAKNEYSAPTDAAGVAIWQVTWTTPVLWGIATADDTAPALTQLWINGALVGGPVDIFAGLETGAPAVTAPIGDPPGGTS